MLQPPPSTSGGQAAGAQQSDARGQPPRMLDDGGLVAQRTGDRIVSVPARQHHASLLRAELGQAPVQAASRSTSGA
jgi:hypothetical protein